MDVDFNVMREAGFFTRIEKNRKKDMKRVDQQGGWKYIDNCPVCGQPSSSDTEIKYSEMGIESIICNNCKCLHNNKIPKNPIEKYNLADSEDISDIPYEKKYDYRKKRFCEERIKIIEKYLTYKPLEKARLLDVGCGTGFFLDVEKQYCNHVEGIETSKAIAKYAFEKRGLKIHTADLLGFKPNYAFDIISMFDVIEHVGNPFEFLLAAKKLLNRGGIIMIFTPNYVSLAFDILGTKSNLYCPTEHLLFFSKPTVEYIAEKLSMNLSMFETKGMDIFDIMAFERDINKIDIVNSLIVQNINMIQKHIDDMGFANHMRVILRKI